MGGTQLTLLKQFMAFIVCSSHNANLQDYRIMGLTTCKSGTNSKNFSEDSLQTKADWMPLSERFAYSRCSFLFIQNQFTSMSKVLF